MGGVRRRHAGKARRRLCTSTARHGARLSGRHGGESEGGACRLRLGALRRSGMRCDSSACVQASACLPLSLPFRGSLWRVSAGYSGRISPGMAGDCRERPGEGGGRFAGRWPGEELAAFSKSLLSFVFSNIGFRRRPVFRTKKGELWRSSDGIARYETNFSFRGFSTG